MNYTRARKCGISRLMFFMIFSVKISVMDIESVKKLAVLCRIDIKEDEIEELRKEMGAILQYVGKYLMLRQKSVCRRLSIEN